ncbi:alpha/beta hydrolase family protein [Gracilibacillus phocaeensis]|uniref:alpha/beta hydrolase family protein n=1 Tax=Gracilibacillus phocaeensis TaxID=2042304 RepID=UPI0010324DD0|nr:acetylxylan esterase [Gracilibacillus phocaeensis]
MYIRSYLNQVAGEITERPLPSFSSDSEYFLWKKSKQRQFKQMLGIDTFFNKPRTPLNVTITGTLQSDTHRIEKIYYESLPGLYVTAHLYVPNDVEVPAPALIYLCGHSLSQKINYQDHPRKFAQLGFVTLIIDTIQFGEVQGMHHGTYAHGQFQWISKGYTPAATEVWNAVRGIDLMTERQEVDPDKIGITGHSGGGAISWWTACCDDRIKAAAASSGTGTIASQVRERTIDTHCDCIFPNNPYGWSLIESYALMAPRPMLIISPDRDRNYTIDSVQFVYEKLKALYCDLGCKEKIQLFDFHAHHSYSSASRKAAFSWFLQHLKGEGHHPVSDIDGKREGEEELLVYQGKQPANDESTSVQEWLIALSQQPSITTPQELTAVKENVIQKLKQESFAAFPNYSIPLAMETKQKYFTNEDSWHHTFSIISEYSWRITGFLQGEDMQVSHSPTAIYLQSPGGGDGFKFHHIPMIHDLPSSWLQAMLEVRGVGESAWGPEINWHVRRSLALTGRTVASLRVWDVLRGVQALRSMPEVHPDKIVIAAEKDMTVPALYAALLDQRIYAVILKDPPASQDIPSNPNGNDHLIEMINALRHTDLPQVAGLIWPTKLIFLGNRPKSYRWSEAVHKKLGEPGGAWRVQELAGFNIL